MCIVAYFRLALFSSVPVRLLFLLLSVSLMTRSLTLWKDQNDTTLDVTIGDADPSPGWNDSSSSSAEMEATADMVDVEQQQLLLPEQLPSAPRDVEPMMVSSRFVTLRWKEPLKPNGDITGYSVLYRQEGSERYLQL